MGELNGKINKAVWFDIPVSDLDRASDFYGAVLDIKIHREKFGNIEFSVLDHQDGNGGCLIIRPNEISDKGLLLYLNVNGRIKDACEQVKKCGGKIIEDIQSIGPHGFRAIILDSEGNRIVLHSETDG